MSGSQRIFLSDGQQTNPVEGADCVGSFSRGSCFWLLMNSGHGVSGAFPFVLRAGIFPSQGRLQLGEAWEHAGCVTYSEILIPASAVAPYRIAYSSTSSTYFVLSFIIFVIHLPLQLDYKLLGDRKNPSSFLPRTPTCLHLVQGLTVPHA